MARASAARRRAPAWAALSLLVSSGWLAACSPEPPAALGPVPEPDLSALEEAVRDELAEARSALDTLERGSPEALSNGFGELGMLYLAHGLVDPAVACFANARQLAPSEFRWSYYLGRSELGRSDPAAARLAFEQALEIRREDPPTLLALGRLALDRGEKGPAESYFRRALAANPASASALLGLGRVAAASQDPETAIQHFERALELQPAATAVHYSLGLAYREAGDVERARRHLGLRGERSTTEADPLMAAVADLSSGSRAHLLRAGRALGAGRLTEGEAELRRAVELDPNHPTARVTLGALLAQRGDRSAARQELEAALGLDPEDPRAHYNLGLLAAQAGHELEAVARFQSALAADPGHGPAAYQLGEAFLRLGRDAEAVDYLARARELRPTSETARLREVSALAGAGRYSEARSRLEEGLALLPESVPLAHALARLLAAAPDARVRDGERALELATEVAREGGLFEGRIDFDHGQTLALAYAEIGRYDRAVALQEALVAAAERDGRSSALPALREMLTLYQSGSPGRLSSLPGDPFLAPAPRGTLESSATRGEKE